MNEFDVIHAQEIMGKTEDAYMRDSYGDAEWFRCIMFMLEEGLDKKDILTILHHKHMRWANDEFGGNEIAAGAGADEFIAYYRKYNHRWPLTRERYVK